MSLKVPEVCLEGSAWFFQDRFVRLFAHFVFSISTKTAPCLSAGPLLSNAVETPFFAVLVALRTPVFERPANVKPRVAEAVSLEVKVLRPSFLQF